MSPAVTSGGCCTGAVAVAAEPAEPAEAVVAAAVVAAVAGSAVLEFVVPIENRLAEKANSKTFCYVRFHLISAAAKI